jgi:hypothetical protein
MPTLAAMLKQLESKRDRTKTEFERLNEAIAALRKLGPGENARRRGRRRGRKLSAAARRKISAAQKRRWAKARKHGVVEAQGKG